MELDLLSYACMHAVNLGHACCLETMPLKVLKEEVEKKWETTNGDWEDDVRFAYANIMVSDYHCLRH